MFSGPPLPLPADFPLSQLTALAGSSLELGAWVRCEIRELRLRARAPGRRYRILISGDLGRLLGRCSRVAVREGSRPVVVVSEALIQWRALQVVTGTPHLCWERIEEVFPGARRDPNGFHVPINIQSPEAVLADCLVHGIPVVRSRIAYDMGVSHHPASDLEPVPQPPVDVALSALLR